jgi:hypothetical protein
MMGILLSGASRETLVPGEIDASEFNPEGTDLRFRNLLVGGNLWFDF